MADSKISALTGVSSVAGTNEFAVNESGTSKKATAAQIRDYLISLGMPQVLALGSAYTNSSTTGSEVASLSFNSQVAGKYFVRWVLYMQSAATTTSPKFGVNVSANLTSLAANAYFPSAGVTAATGTWHDANNATTGQVWAYANTRTASTTAPNLGPWVGVTNANVDHLCIVEALIVTSGTADIELWAGSEVGASQIQLSIGSSGILYRTA